MTSSQRFWRRDPEIYVGEFVNQAYLRLATQDRVGVHFVINACSILDSLAGNSFETFSLFDRVLPPVTFEITDHDVYAVGLELLSFLQHAVGLAGAGRVSKKDFEFATHRYWGKTRTSMPAANSISRSTSSF